MVVGGQPSTEAVIRAADVDGGVVSEQDVYTDASFRHHRSNRRWGKAEYEAFDGDAVQSYDSIFEKCRHKV
ncbi:hypothetical protein Ppa06_36710 [Planomonospora parontospora subsp. parontospora]|uniref:Uncharacterized protein n=2 Tax=Planomonospora parontospora TaxID=58119 RepID=A0AA37F4T8_9ACTN|nr:hypothetical protein GCM10010126_31730 [Planomonospora parontospora]GII09873.1 hypothetical protein Ppa06_36710 [Planomonospora parontospora subsp. parontospora]